MGNKVSVMVSQGVGRPRQVAFDPDATVGAVVGSNLVLASAVTLLNGQTLAAGYVLQPSDLLNGLIPAATTTASGVSASSGTYTPTAVAVANVSSVTPAAAQYMRVDNVVTVSGSASVTPTATGGTLTQFRITLPVASNFAASGNASGTGTVQESPYVPALVSADAATDQAVIGYNANTAGAQTVYFQFTYLII
jgi:hypothetical protein